MKKIDKGLISGSTTMLILSLLETGDKYGYEMIKELELRSDKAFELKEGTLYPILHGLENDGMIRSYSAQAPSGRERKYYQLTRRGILLLKDKKAEWELFAQMVNRVIGGEVHAIR